MHWITFNDIENLSFAISIHRLNRDQLNAPNIGCVSEFERHNSEIAGFHVDRLLGFRRALPVTGRKINIKTEFWGICDSKLNGTFFISEKPDENVCFTGNCEKYCEIDHPICSEGDQLEVSFIHWINELDYQTFIHNSWCPSADWCPSAISLCAGFIHGISSRRSWRHESNTFTSISTNVYNETC